ncbi:hypothetical protein NQ318_011983 [Aromia moschata]|uniref:Uncharacterized protein n=1 Tax=Aromia moschata TaxID=1265417 RepID=A0AAV8Y0T6_9CUCU|nr:hypothetical protein NQ318_011983 [Aromia moschata]
MSIDAHVYNLVQQDLMNVVALDYDMMEQKMYFCDVTAKTIFRSSIGTNEKNLSFVMTPMV